MNNTPIPRRSYEKQFKRDDGALMLAGDAVQCVTFDDDMGFSGVAGGEKEQEESREEFHELGVGRGAKRTPR